MFRRTCPAIINVIRIIYGNDAKLVQFKNLAQLYFINQPRSTKLILFKLIE